MNSYEVKDGRGVSRQVCPFSDAVRESGLDPVEVAPPAHRAMFWRTSLSVGAFFTVLMTAVLGAILAPMHGWKVWAHLPLWSPVMFVGFGFPMGFIASRYGWRSAQAGCDALLVAGLCPHCAHGIAGIPSESDGCTVCPECGSAWRVVPGGSSV